MDANDAPMLARERRPALWGLGLPPIVLFVLLIIGAARGYSGDVMTIWVLGTVTLSLGLIPIAVNNSLPRGRGHVLIAFLALIYGGYFGMPALVRYAPEGGNAVPGSMGDQFVVAQDVVSAQWIALMGLVALLLAYANPALGAAIRRLPPLRHDWPTGTTTAVATGMLVVGWAFTVVLAAAASSSGLGSGFSSTLSSAQLFALILLVREWELRRNRGMLIALLVLVPIATIFGALTGSKREALNAVAIVVITRMVIKETIGWRWVVLGVLGIAILYPFNRYYQDYLIGGARTSAVEALADPGRIVNSLSRFVAESNVFDLLEEGLDATALRIDGLGVTSVIVRETPGLVPYQNGRTIALIFVAPIPRAIWPDKPEFTVGQWVTDTYSHGLDTRTAPTQIGELYFNFGWVGVLVGMLVLGSLMRVMSEALTGEHATAASMLVSIVVIYYFCTKFESAIAKQYSNVLFAVVPLILVHAAIRILGMSEERSLVRGSTGSSTASPADGPLAVSYPE
ncbi:MAG: O-antigen polysaccharide polymerase Wzy family protein [bacterium]|nr:O-antigen polysaccharide polymerase Wzy family protein [bacterium]